MNLKKIFIVLIVLIMSMFAFVGCNKEENIEEAVNNYAKLLNDGKYEELYEELSNESKKYIDEEYESKEGFVQKYFNIYSAMGVNNIRIDMKDSENKLEIPITITMNTIAGELKFDDANIKLVKEDNKYKVLWNESLILPQMIQGDKIRVKTTNGSRGRILDRNDNLLAYNGEVNFINIVPGIFEENKNENIIKMADILDISEEYIEDKLNKSTNSDEALFIVKVSNYEQEKVKKLSDINGVSVQKGISRVYAQGEAFGSLLGYIGSITEEELSKNSNKGYTSYSQIGKNGLEQVYEDELRAKEGVHIYIERGDEQITIAKTEASDGEDIKLSIDSELQEDIYNQMNKEKGASIAMDPKTGEVLAMVSSPSYDSNTLVTYKTKTIAQNWEKSNNAEFDNRANNAYSPGSTMKLITASIGLENKVINPNEKMEIKGLYWQNSSSWGDYKVTRVKDAGSVNLYEAVKYSDNIYFADKSIKIGAEKYIEEAKKFGIGVKSTFEYPMAKSQISNNGKLEDELLLADTGYGQGEVLTTPLEITMAYSSLGNDGNIMTPRLVISENNEAKIYSKAISKDYLPELKKCFSAVINDSDGSGNLAKIKGVNLAGKTGTAEIKGSKDDKSGSENSWFAAVDLDNSKIAISMVMEDMKEKSTSQYLVPKVKNVIENYLNRK
ncbi:penicillin-binding transpeptidase domain-containing protein [Romboutsia ilealis]|uniref:Penicillin-binding transpeptidase domain-containing protein n=1 Tax=Romboutsia faecis TaxID=2764597 RepID=A0ABR7JKG5_9FIRM|nr:penicillin-binding transpeptidase domain-containing protein [Romboutsia faecis]MBC5995183.1 penicillin-binding transpeptidase domain-containing protein [Romboutsia faecis]MRN25901.1 penicillin-binding transpeptidase domain-containing protein [Romboutsia ilealis]